MRNSKRFSHTAAIVILAGAVLVPAATFARGGGAHFGHGPAFGFHHAPIVAHRPFRPVGMHRFPGRFAGWWRLQRFTRNRGNNWNGAAGDGYYPAGAYAPGDVTGTLAPLPGVYAPPGGPAPEHVGCVARGYEVASESGVIARVTVTRC